MVMPMLYENSAMRPELKLDYIECAFGIKLIYSFFIDYAFPMRNLG